MTMQTFEIETRAIARLRERSESGSIPWEEPVHRMSFRRNIPGEGEIERQFQNDLAETKLDDNQDLELLEFVKLGNYDKEGRETLLLIANHIPDEVTRMERAQRFILKKLESVGSRSYSILYIHTESIQWSNHTGLKLMWNLLRRYRLIFLRIFGPGVCRIPRVYRQRLHRVYVLHPDIYLQLVLWISRWLMPFLWEKVRFFRRIEELQYIFPSIPQSLPSFVKEHDDDLYDHPLMDYGFITTPPPRRRRVARYLLNAPRRINNYFLNRPVRKWTWRAISFGMGFLSGNAVTLTFGTLAVNDVVAAVVTVIFYLLVSEAYWTSKQPNYALGLLNIFKNGVTTALLADAVKLGG